LERGQEYGNEDSSRSSPDVCFSGLRSTILAARFTFLGTLKRSKIRPELTLVDEMSDGLEGELKKPAELGQDYRTLIISTIMRDTNLTQGLTKIYWPVFPATCTAVGSGKIYSFQRPSLE
jgi:hypothetical protein